MLRQGWGRVCKKREAETKTEEPETAIRSPGQAPPLSSRKNNADSSVEAVAPTQQE